MWAALCRQMGGRTGSSRGGCAQQGRSSDPSRQICSPPGGWGWAPSSSSTHPWCCRGSCTVQRSLGPSQRPSQGAQLETFHNGCLRQMMGLHRGPDGPSTAELLARSGQANMADHMRRHRVRWLGHAARKPNDVMVKQLLLRTPSRATLGPWGAPTSHGWTPPCMTWAA